MLQTIATGIAGATARRRLREREKCASTSAVIIAACSVDQPPQLSATSTVSPGTERDVPTRAIGMPSNGRIQLVPIAAIGRRTL
jgi:hypothetical protein